MTLIAGLKGLCGGVFLSLFLTVAPTYALQLDDLAPEKEWKTYKLVIEGNEQLPTSRLQSEMVTTTRSWYALWRSRPHFDPVAFKTDIERLQRLYRAQGYYDAQVTYELEAKEESALVTAHILVSEGEPVRVSQLALEVTDDPTLNPSLETLRAQLPVSEGNIFTEEGYQEAETRIKALLLDQHRGRATVKREATVALDQHRVDVRYQVEAGPPTVFGDTTIEGTKLVEPEMIARELTYAPGEPFSAKAVNDSREKIFKLDLFSAVRFIQEDSPADPRVIPMRVKVDEKAFREWQAGIGFGTEDQVRGQVQWRHNNWFGDGRRLDVQVRASSLVRHIDVNFIQPHFLETKNRFSLTARTQQLDEESFLLNGVRLQPRLERDFTRHLTGFVGYRLEYDKLSDVTDATASVLQEFQRKGVLSGVATGFVWTTTDDPLNATRGGLASLTAEYVGGPLSGDFEFWKLYGEARRYYRLSSQLVLAGRLKLGFADPFGKSKEVPLFERFFAGGVNSVRGYGRYRLGPISDSDDPVGGRSMVEGAIELRRQFTEQLGGAIFLDFGQVSLKSFDLPIDDLEFATGVGVLYTTPVGPVLLALGFPLDAPPGDQSWQVHFSIGQFF